jgi:hypothetical protein
MCLNPGLELLSTSRLGELSSAENDVSLDFLEKENKNFPGGTIRNMPPLIFVTHFFTYLENQLLPLAHPTDQVTIFT